MYQTYGCKVVSNDAKPYAFGPVVYSATRKQAARDRNKLCEKMTAGNSRVWPIVITRDLDGQIISQTIPSAVN